MGRQNTMAYHSKRDSTDVPSLFDDANVSLTGIHNHTEAKYRDVPNHPISRPFLGIPKAQNSILPLPQECPDISITEVSDVIPSTASEVSPEDPNPLSIRINRRYSDSLSMMKAPSDKVEKDRSSSISTPGGREDATKLRSILKTRSSSPSATSIRDRRRSAVDFLENAKENTLNFLIPTRQLDARRRILKRSYKWWNEMETESKNNKTPYQWLPNRSRKAVHFEFDQGQFHFERLPGGKSRRNSEDGAMTSYSSSNPSLPSFQLRRWQKIGRIMGVAMGLKLNAQGRQSTSDPEIDTSFDRDDDSKYEHDESDTISLPLEIQVDKEYVPRRSLSLESLDIVPKTRDSHAFRSKRDSLCDFENSLIDEDFDLDATNLRLTPPSLSSSNDLSFPMS